MAEKRKLYRVLSDNMKEREPLQDVGVEGRIMLWWSLMKYSLCGLESSVSG